MQLLINEGTLFKAIAEVRNAEELAPFASGSKFSASDYKIFSAEGLTPGMFLDSRLCSNVTLQKTYECLLARSANISSSDTLDDGVLPSGALGKFCSRKFDKIGIFEVLKKCCKTLLFSEKIHLKREKRDSLKKREVGLISS